MDMLGSQMPGTPRIFVVNEPQTRLDRTSVICGAFGGLVAVRLICYTLNHYTYLMSVFHRAATNVSEELVAEVV
ncbi:hypothetical protein TSMEX_007027 [Taenia solium]|eukprot:TsM_000730800 transcript=TsM_000730800 gene=TsM_000730800